MDHLQLLSPQRLARALGAFLLGFILSLAAVPAFAAYEASLMGYWTGYGYKTTLSEALAACPPGSSAVAGGDGTMCNPAKSYRCLRDSDLAAVGSIRADMGCPYGGTLTCPSTCSGTPTCPAGQEFDAATATCKVPECAAGQVRNTITQQCQPPCHPAGTAGGSNYVSPFTKHPPSICRDGCSLTVGGGTTIPHSGGTWYMVTGLVHTGNFCSGAEGASGSGEGTSYDEPGDPEPITVTPDEDPPRCKAGQCPGEVNGIFVCVSCTDVATPDKPVTQYDKKTETTTTGTPPNQTTETKTTETKSTHDGSGTVTSTTTTSTTKTDANGTTTTDGKAEKKESQESFCKENPTSTFCKEGKWGGSCDAFTCEGDAVECALSREVHQRNCEASKSNAYTDLTDAAEAGTDNASGYIQAQKDAAALDVNARFSQSLDASPIAASCPASRSVALPGGNSLEISFEKPCEIAGWLGHFVQAFAYLFAALIVLRNPT